MRKIIKGNYGYLQAKRRQVLLRTLLFFGISLALFVAGYVQTGTKQNLLTVVAVLGCLPACKSLVNLILYVRARGCSPEVKEKIMPLEGRLVGMYDLYFTSYQKNFAISHMVVDDKVILGLTEDSGCDEKACQEHLNTLLKQSGYKDMTIQISHQGEKYEEQLRKLNEEAPTGNPEREDEIRRVLYEISL